MYRHTQVGHLVLGIMAASVLFTVWVLQRAGAPAGAWASLVVLGVISVLFGSLTVEVDRDQLRFWFGPGFLRRTVPLEEITASRVVTNRWWYGWGIRRIPGGWMYNISGLKAVELTLRGGKMLRVGTDEPEVLNRRIEMARAAR